MLNFPIPYPEELLYSTIARAGIRQGLISPKQLLDEVFESRTVIATVDLPSHIAKVARWLPSKLTPEALLYCHTLFPLYGPFVPEDRRSQCVRWLIGSQGATHLALGVAASRVQIPRFVRYCPDCLVEQRNQYGEYFWLREWQVEGIDACPEHGVLINTRIARPLIERHHYIAASPESCSLIKQRTGTKESLWISRQVRQLLQAPAQTSPSFEQWSVYYRNLASKLDLTYRKTQINHQAIKDRVLQAWSVQWLSRHQLLPQGSSANESDWLRCIFRKHRKSFNYLEHIVVHQALLGSNWQITDAIKEASQCPTSKNKQPPVQVKTQEHVNLTPDQEGWLNLLASHPPKQARHSSKALYARLYRKHREWLLETNYCHAGTKTKVLTQRVDWDKRDREYLHALRQLAVFLKANLQGPRRSRNYYFNLLENAATVEKNINRMPLSKSFLIAHIESTAQYQIRRLQNAYNDLLTLFDVPPRWRLLRNAKLSDERLTEKARVFLETLVSTQHDIQKFRKQ
ncbi:MAG: TnsD family Tn7-like transposition protein [Atribacterota bacterium]|jgi:hypothetical protein|nr:TnsD family Tn7-like transposition protein [Atribacterota bacterium]MDY0414796.1 TnsD family Tn7-like transposition protein [Pseudomonas sp.]